MDAANPSRRVLIVDDDQHATMLLADALRRAGYEVTIAENADEALAAVAASPPDLAVLDIRMRGTSGLDLGATLRDDYSVPFIFLTLVDDEETVRRATEVGAITYLVKPLDMRHCVPAIEAALARAIELRRLRETETQLSTALRQSREISMAIGLLMERLRLDRNSAFEMLREDARRRRQKMSEVADELLRSVERLNSCAQPASTRARRNA